MKIAPRAAAVVALAATGTLGLSACGPEATVVGATQPGSSSSSNASNGSSDTGSSSSSTAAAPTSSAAAPATPKAPVSFSKAPAQPGDLDGKVVANNKGRKVAVDASLPTVKLGGTPDADGKLPNSAWPDAQTLFSVKEIAAVFPDAKSVTVKNCQQTEDYDTGDLTAHNTKCELVTPMPDDYSASDASKLKVEIQDVGTEDYILSDFDRDRTSMRKVVKDDHSTGQYFWYKDGSFGTQRYYSSYGTAKVVVGDGKNAMSLEIEPDGYYNLAPDDHNFDIKKEDASDKIMREQIMPLVLQLLAARF